MFTSPDDENCILSPGAMRKLTGYRQIKKQCEWLAQAGIWFKPSGDDGRPSTTWYHVNNPLTVRKSQHVDSVLTEPNFDAM